jgi:hypothetical protein
VWKKFKAGTHGNSRLTLKQSETVSMSLRSGFVGLKNKSVPFSAASGLNICPNLAILVLEGEVRGKGCHDQRF